jgi:hypothetical protein
VTTLADAGPGSFRDAISQDDRYIVFDVAGTILSAADYLWAHANLTIDGGSAPSPGVTISGRGLLIRGSRGGRNVILTGLRFRNCVIDCVTVDGGATDVVIDHNSMSGAGDGNLDVGWPSGVRNVTVSWNLIHTADGQGKTSLTAYTPQHLSYHHNLYSGLQRNPQVRYDDAGGQSPGTTVDFVNNLSRAAGVNHGAWFRFGVKANLVNNYFLPWATDLKDILILEGPASQVYRAGNTHPGRVIGEVTFAPTPFPAPPITTTDAFTAACQVLAMAGPPFPRDAVDQTVINAVVASIPLCP